MRPNASAARRHAGHRFWSGGDLGFRVARQEGNRVIGTLVVRINGEWFAAGTCPQSEGTQPEVIMVAELGSSLYESVNTKSNCETRSSLLDYILGAGSNPSVSAKPAGKRIRTNTRPFRGAYSFL